MYLKLYDDTTSTAREAFQPLMERISDGFKAEGVHVQTAPICRVAGEFGAAVSSFEKAAADMIVTLHLAYSPSLEAADALCRSSLPVLMLDTTMDLSFGCGVAPERIMYNHGIHGVQDLASVLKRRGKFYRVVAGHMDEYDPVPRAADMAKAAMGATTMKHTRALRLGVPFAGMGDFAVPDVVMAEVIGIKTEQISPDELVPAALAITEDEVSAETASDRDMFEVTASHEVLQRTNRVGLALRRYLETGGYGAFSMNFLAFDSSHPPINTVPFLEASKAMARGIGYAGEGDVLTASLVEAMLAAFGEATFTEIFCPDWEGEALFLSHMGEINPAVAAGKPLVFEKDFPYTAAMNPASVACSLRSGPAVLVNLAPGLDNSFSLIASPVEILEDTSTETMRTVIRSWIQPDSDIAEFLERYSMLGGTHHSAIVPGNHIEALAVFAEMLGLEFHLL